MPVSAIILDAFDTTLVRDRKDVLHDPYREMLLDLGISSPSSCLKEDRAFLLTTTTSFKTYLERHITPLSNIQPAALLASMDSLFAYHYNAYNPRPEWEDFVEQAKTHQIKLCIGSNLATPYIRTIKDKLPQAAHHVYSCEIGLQKPDAAFFQHFCDIMGTHPQETLMIGNSYRSDITGARNAGLADAFWIPDTNRVIQAAEKGTTLIRSLNDVFPLLHNKKLLP